MKLGSMKWKGEVSNMKAKTVEQFKVIQYINDNFEKGSLKLTLIDRFTIKAEDSTGDSIIFYYDNESKEIKTREVES